MTAEMQDRSDVQACQELVSRFTKPQVSREYDRSPDLPVELVQEAVVRVDSTNALYNLCLVSKRFNELATPQLYRSVFLSSAEHIRRFSALLARSPDLGCVVRELWMFQSIVFRDEKWGDETDSNWMPSDDDSISSSSENSDFEDQTENMDIDLEVDDVNVPVQNSGAGAALLFPREEIPQIRLATILSSSRPNTSIHDVIKAWVDFTNPIVSPGSIVYAHACAILRSCPSLESLYLPWSGLSLNEYSSCLHALTPFARLRELAVYRASDLLNSGFADPLHFMDTSNLCRLTILDTTSPQLPAGIPEMFPHLTHLRISLDIFDDMVSYLSRFKALTHLWLAPNGEKHRADDLENFFEDLRIKCPNIKRVRVDVPFESYDVPQIFGTANGDLFRFVSIQDSVMQKSNSMRVFDAEVPLSSSGDESTYLYNAYTKRLEYYWDLRLTGGGWDD